MTEESAPHVVTWNTQISLPFTRFSLWNCPVAIKQRPPQTLRLHTGWTYTRKHGLLLKGTAHLQVCGLYRMSLTFGGGPFPEGKVYVGRGPGGSADEDRGHRQGWSWEAAHSHCGVLVRGTPCDRACRQCALLPWEFLQVWAEGICSPRACQSPWVMCLWPDPPATAVAAATESIWPGSP